MLIQEYENYLIREGLSERSARIYTRKIQDLLSQGYNEETICNAIEEFIYMYSRGGKCYDPKDHGNTLSALKRLRNMLLEPYAENFFISYMHNNDMMCRYYEYVKSYEISNGQIQINYATGFDTPTKTVIKKIPANRYFALISLVKNYSYWLSASDTALKGFHGVAWSYSYNFVDKSGYECKSIFDGSEKDSTPELAMDAFREWMRPYKIYK